mgnify:CR=1 FL=1
MYEIPYSAGGRDEMMVEILKRNLEKWGYLARGITDFQNVMDEFQSFEPQLVLMDISLPFYNGYYWCGEIRKVSQVPVIFLSSSGDDMNLVMAIQLGADDFVAKPFRMDVLTAKIQAVLRRHHIRGVQPGGVGPQRSDPESGFADTCFRGSETGTRKE